MPKLAHARLSSQKKIKASELLELGKKPDPTAIGLGFGKYAGKNISLAELALNHTGYFYWAFYSGALKQFNPWLEFQAWEISEKAKHILPPRKRPDDWAFDMEFDQSGKFRDFQVVKKNAPAKAGRLRVKHLDLSLMSMQNAKDCQKMAERISEEFFPDKKLTRWDYEEFFKNARNFDLSCRETHCPKIPRRVAAKRSTPENSSTEKSRW